MSTTANVKSHSTQQFSIGDMLLTFLEGRQSLLQPIHIFFKIVHAIYKTTIGAKVQLLQVKSQSIVFKWG
jgi:hypothetical protein